MKIWNDKHKPKNIGEIPHPQATSILKAAVANKRAILLHGPTGIGKTTLAHTLANEEDYEILEINASDVRNKDEITKIIGASSEQMSLFNKEKIILIDEADGVSGTKDRGGMQAIASVIPKSKHAIIITANDINDPKIKSLKKLVTVIELGKVNHEFIKSKLKDICEKEKIRFEETHVDDIALKSAGDIRAAINDLQAHAAIDNNLNISELISRDAEESMKKVLSKVFKSDNMFESLNALDRTDNSLDEIMLWIDYNLPKEYKNSNDLAKAYEMLSKADVFRGRIRRQQYWRYLVYQKALMSAGVTKAKDNYYPSFTKYERTSRLLKIWWANRKNAKKKDIAGKIARKTHTSTKDVMTNFAFYKKFLKNEKIQRELRLTSEQIDFING